MRRVSFVVAAMLALGTASAARAQGLVVGPYAEFQTGFTVGSTVGGLFGGEAGIQREYVRHLFRRRQDVEHEELGDGRRRRDDCRVARSRARRSKRSSRPTTSTSGSGTSCRPRENISRMRASASAAPASRARRSSSSTAPTSRASSSQMGVLLGGDLQGSERGFLFTLGGGARIGLTGQAVRGRVVPVRPRLPLGRRREHQSHPVRHRRALLAPGVSLIFSCGRST